MSPTLGLHYAPTMNDLVLAALEKAARDTGIPLWQVELLGQDCETALAFADAVADDCHAMFLEHVDWDGLEARLHQDTVPAPFL